MHACTDASFMVWAQAKRLTQEEYAMNHPAGRIGKRLILRVHDVMLTGSALPLAAPDTLIMEVRQFLAHVNPSALLRSLL